MFFLQNTIVKEVMADNKRAFLSTDSFRSALQVAKESGRVGGMGMRETFWQVFCGIYFYALNRRFGLESSHKP